MNKNKCWPSLQGYILNKIFDDIRECLKGARFFRCNSLSYKYKKNTPEMKYLTSWFYFFSKLRPCKCLHSERIFWNSCPSVSLSGIQSSFTPGLCRLILILTSNSSCQMMELQVELQSFLSFTGYTYTSKIELLYQNSEKIF